MRTTLGVAVVFSCAWLAAACGDTDNDSSTQAGGGGGGGGATMAAGGDTTGAGGDTTGTSADSCHDGCIQTLAADCSMGPASQAVCESDCHGLETGNCGGPYATFQACAEGEPVTCAQGFPAVAACSDEQTAFVACLNQ